jgi:WD40 repeat protein
VLALGSEQGEVQIVRLADGKTLSTIAATDQEVRQLAFDSSGRYLMVLRRHAELWDVRSYERVHEFDDVPMVASVMFAAGGTRVVLAHTTSHQLRSVPDGKLVGASSDSPWVLGVPASSAGGFVLLTRLHQIYNSRVGGDGENWLLDTLTGERVALPGGPHGRGGLSPDGRLIAMPQPDGAIELFDREAGKIARTLRGHDRKVNCVRFSADGSVFVTGWASLGLADSHDDRRVCVWSKDGELLQQLEFERSGIAWLDISRDGRWIVVKTNDGELSRYPVRPLEVVEALDLRDFSAQERARYEIR